MKSNLKCRPYRSDILVINQYCLIFHCEAKRRINPMRKLITFGVLAMLFGFSAVVVAADKAPAAVECHMKFNLKGWSVFYKTAEGGGRVTCNNGEKAKVKIKVTGGGLTFGKMDIRDGNGTFSEVLHIDENDEIAAMGLGTPSNALLGSIKSLVPILL